MILKGKYNKKYNKTYSYYYSMQDFKVFQFPILATSPGYWTANNERYFFGFEFHLRDDISIYYIVPHLHKW